MANSQTTEAIIHAAIVHAVNIPDPHHLCASHPHDRDKPTERRKDPPFRVRTSQNLSCHYTAKTYENKNPAAG